MIQKTYHITDYEPFKLREILTCIASLEEYRSAEQVLVIVLEQCWDTGIIKEKTDMIKSVLPKAETVGTNHFDAYDPEEAAHCNSIVTFMFFGKRAFAIDHIGLKDNTDAEAGRLLGDTVSRYSPLQGVLLFISHDMRDVGTVLSEAEKGLTDVPFFGAASGSVEPTPDNPLSYVFDTQGIYTDTIAAVSFYGSDLNIRVSYNYGWTPVGKTMTVTATDGDFRVTGIDGKPAADIYKRYLGLDCKKGMITTPNICEFPLIIENDGLMIGRVPFNSTKDGTLNFGAAVKKGSRIRLSYGAQHLILSETYNDSKEFGRFAPQGMFMVVCGNRLIFLKDDEKKEIDYYRRICPDLAFAHGNSEIYRLNGKGGELHSALVAVGIREGEKDRSVLQCTVPPYQNKGKSVLVPLEHRVMTFMHAVTNDLEEMTEKANAANEAKSSFLSNMSHEIRTPLNAVLGMNEMILRECDDEQILTYAENIRTAGNTLLGLINDILDFSKIEAGRLDIIPVDYDLASLLNDLVNMIKIRADAKGLQLIVNVDPATPSFLHGDEIRLKQIVTNILTNAVKYTKQGSVTMTVGFTAYDDGSVGLRFSVEDTGIGIKQEDMGKLFEAFERIEEERNRAIEGTGLGMNITRRLLTMMGSKLEAQSEYGKGSVFSFTVRQEVVRNEPVGDFSAALTRTSAGRRSRRGRSFTAPDANVLVVDDTKMNLTVFCSLLKHTKVQTDTAGSGQECLDLTARKKYDIIFLDHRMPDKDGIETLTELRSMPDNLNIETTAVCLTANAVSGAKEEYLAAGFDDYLTKPIEPEKLEAMLLEYLPKKKIEAEGTEEPTQPVSSVIPEWLTTIPEIDTAAGIKHCGNEEIYLSTLQTYAEAVKDAADEIERFWNVNDIKNVTIKVHALKSTSRVIGAADLGAFAERLEAAGNNGDAETLQNELGALLDRYRKLGAALSPLTAQDDDALPLITDDELNDAYTLIRECLSVADFDSAMQVIEDMSGYRFPENEKDRFAKLKKAASEVDYDAIAKILA